VSAPGSGRAPSATTVARLRAQLRDLPAFRALLRSVEETLVAGCQPLPAPVLDLGCGDGDFGARALGAGALGLDPDLAALARGPRGGRSCAASATAMPFPDRCLGSVVANSVLEHIPDLDATLDECARVLRPGGRLVVTSPNPRFSELLAGSTVSRALGLDGLARRYAASLNRRSRHYHLLDREEWRRRLESRGLAVATAHDYFGAPAHRAFDLLHYLGAPALIARRLTGRWVPWRNPLTLALAVRWLAPLASPAPVEGGAYTFVIAERR
jgi:SAM-dependent methyltransferase